jgi:hypothetical protein
MTRMKFTFCIGLLACSLLVGPYLWRRWIKIQLAIHKVEISGGAVGVSDNPLSGPSSVSFRILGVTPIIDDDKFADLSVYLSNFSNLRQMDLHETRTSDKVIPTLCRLQNLNYLDVSWTGIDISGVSMILKGLPNLKGLVIDQDQIDTFVIGEANLKGVTLYRRSKGEEFGVNPVTTRP